jgi:hypothetical protein
MVGQMFGWPTGNERVSQLKGLHMLKIGKKLLGLVVLFVMVAAPLGCLNINKEPSDTQKTVNVGGQHHSAHDGRNRYGLAGIGRDLEAREIDDLLPRRVRYALEYQPGDAQHYQNDADNHCAFHGAPFTFRDGVIVSPLFRQGFRPRRKQKSRRGLAPMRQGAQPRRLTR